LLPMFAQIKKAGEHTLTGLFVVLTIA